MGEVTPTVIPIPPKILYNQFLIFQLFFPLLGGLLFGYNTAVISGLLLQINFENVLPEYIVTSTIFGAAISSLLGGLLANQFGRKYTLIISSLFSVCGSIIMASSGLDLIVLIVGRFVVGIGIGLTSTVTPIYIAEISPEEVRGRLILVFQCTIAGGQFLASIINASFNYMSLYFSLWRIILGFPAIIAIIQLIGLTFIPETHRWLISKNNIQKAKNVIRMEKRINEDNIDEYVDDILMFNKDAKLSLTQRNIQDKNVLYQVMYSKSVRKSLFIGCAVQMICQIVGINGIIYYSSWILSIAGVHGVHNILWYTVLVMFFCFFPLLIGFFLVDRIGRRKLALVSLGGIFLSTVILAVGFQVSYYTSDVVTQRMVKLNDFINKHCSDKQSCEACVTNIYCGYCAINITSMSYCLAVNETNAIFSVNGPCSYKNATDTNTKFYYSYCNSKYKWIILVGMALYLLSFNIGMGPVPWIVTSEIYPPWSRDFSMSLSTFINWIFNILISLIFLSLTEWITRFGTFWLFSGITFIGFGIIYKYLLETNQRTLEEITWMLDHNIIYI